LLLNNRYTRSETTIKWLLHSYGKNTELSLNIPLDTDFAVYSRTETQKESLLLYQVYWQLCFGYVVIFKTN